MVGIHGLREAEVKGEPPLSISKKRWSLIVGLVICGYAGVFAGGFMLGKVNALKEHHSTFVSGLKRDTLNHGIYILAGSFAKKVKAINLVNKLKQSGYRVLLMNKTPRIPLYRVFVGPLREDEVKHTLLTLQKQEKIIGYKVSYALY